MMPTLRNVWDTPFDLLRDVDRAFNNRMNGEHDESTAKYPVDIHEDDDGLTVTAELPGFKKDEVEVSVDSGVLSISAERKPGEQKQEGTTHLRERRYTRVQRQFSLPQTIDTNSVDATLADGVLTLRLQKRDEVKPRKIEVK